MANEIYQTAEIELEDGTKVTLKPLPIKLLRKFMKEWNEGLTPKSKKVKRSEVDDDGETKTVTVEEIVPLTDDDVMNVYTACNALALSRQLAEKVAPVEQFDNYKEYSGLKDEYKDYLEENLNVPNTNKILEICGGITGDDPKLMEAAMTALEDGQN